MKFSCLLMAMILTVCMCNPTHGQTAVPVLKKRTKANVVKYLNQLIATKHVMVGQHCSETTDMGSNYKKAFQAVYDSTGKYPALLGLDYGYFKNVDIEATNRYAIDHWKKGGLVTICWSADNPFTAGYDTRWQPVLHKDSIHLSHLLKNAPASIEKANYRAELHNVAKALVKLQEAGLVVLWRPLHEANGAWFWWGPNDYKNPTNHDGFAALWQDMYETFTQDHGLKNLLWVYSPNIPAGATSLASMYPGSRYVDIVGVDAYTAKANFDYYDDLKQFNKLIVLAEVGPNKGAYGQLDESQVLETLKGKAAYFLQWHSWNNAKVSIADNLNAKQMMIDPAAITLDKMIQE